MTEVTHPTSGSDTTVRTFSYNADGMTSNLTEGSTSRNFVYGANQQLVTQNSTVYIGGVYENDGTTVTKYYFVGGDRIAMKKGSTLYYLTQDQLGGTALITDSSGSMISRIRYYPYGSIRSYDGSDPRMITDKLFTGQQQETPDIYNYKARMYNTNVGRMVQADIGALDANPQDINLYTYASNNPVAMSDPTGHTSYSQSIDARMTLHFYNTGVDSGAEWQFNVRFQGYFDTYGLVSAGQTTIAQNTATPGQFLYPILWWSTNYGKTRQSSASAGVWLETNGVCHHDVVLEWSFTRDISRSTDWYPSPDVEWSTGPILPAGGCGRGNYWVSYWISASRYGSDGSNFAWGYATTCQAQQAGDAHNNRIPNMPYCSSLRN